MSTNIIGKMDYEKSCPLEKRWDLDVSEDQAEKIANATKDGYINIRHVQGKFIQSEFGDSQIWFGDNLGRIAEGLSKGLIQLQPGESKKPLNERNWTKEPMIKAKGWKDTSIVYVSSIVSKPQLSTDSIGKTNTSEDSLKNLKKQAEENPKRILFEASTIFPDQYVGLTKDLKVVIGDKLEDVVSYVKEEKGVKEL